MTLLRTGKKRFLLLVGGLLVPLMVLSVAMGPASIDLSEILRILIHQLGFGSADEISPGHNTIILFYRLPRAVLLLLVGGALSISGVTLQSTFQNSMAAPSILGISGGAALGAVLAIHTGLHEQFSIVLPAAAFVGAMAAMTLVYFLSHFGGRPTTTSLLLTGIAVSSLTLAGVTLTMLWAEEYRLKNVLIWTVGGAEVRLWKEILLAAGPILIGSFLLLLQHRHVDALSLGEEHALSVGVPVQRVRFQFLALCALVSGAAVAVAGTIGFVGLIVPHIVRLLIGPRARALLPASFLVGGGFLVFSDLLARVLSAQNRELPVGIVTSLFGVPFFLWLLHRSRRGAT